MGQCLVLANGRVQSSLAFKEARAVVFARTEQILTLHALDRCWRLSVDMLEHLSVAHAFALAQREHSLLLTLRHLEVLNVLDYLGFCVVKLILSCWVIRLHCHGVDRDVYVAFVVHSNLG